MPKNDTIQMTFKVKDNGTIVIKNASKKIRNEFQKTAKEAKTTNASMSSSFQTTVKSILSVAAAIATIKVGWDAANAAAKFDQQSKSFHNLAKSHSIASEQIIDNLRKTSAGAISTAELIKAAGIAMLLGIDANKLDKLMKIARATSRITAQTMTEAFNDITLAVGRQSRQILDNLGIIVSIEEANKNYAKALGKTSDQLTDNEKKQAFLNETIQKGDDIIERIGVTSVTSAEKLQKSIAQFKDSMTELLKEILPLLTTILKYGKLRSIFDTFTEGMELAKAGLIDYHKFWKASFLERQRMVDSATNRGMGQPDLETGEYYIAPHISSAAELLRIRDKFRTDLLKLEGKTTTQLIKELNKRFEDSKALWIKSGITELQITERYNLELQEILKDQTAINLRIKEDLLDQVAALEVKSTQQLIDELKIRADKWVEQGLTKLEAEKLFQSKLTEINKEVTKKIQTEMDAQAKMILDSYRKRNQYLTSYTSILDDLHGLESDLMMQTYEAHGDFINAEKLKLINWSLDIRKQIQQIIHSIKTLKITSPENVKEIEYLQNMLTSVTEKYNNLRLIIGKTKGAFEEWTQTLKTNFEMLNDIGVSAAEIFANDFVDAIIDAEITFKEFAKTFLQEIAKMIAKQMVLNAIKAVGSTYFADGGVVTNADGNIFNKSGIKAFAKGDIVNKPTIFPFAGGTGLMGEAGPEAIMPLKRGADGKLGVESNDNNNDKKEPQVVNYNIMAMDSKSFVDFVRKNPAAVTTVMNEQMQRHNSALNANIRRVSR